jgi:hypothetical protein
VPFSRVVQNLKFVPLLGGMETLRERERHTERERGHTERDRDREETFTCTIYYMKPVSSLEQRRNAFLMTLMLRAMSLQITGLVCSLRRRVSNFLCSAWMNVTAF